MSRLIFRTLGAGVLLLAVGGCATLSDPAPQQLEVHTIFDNHELAGVGCVLRNDMGRWFLVAPGRVTITRSSTPLTIECARTGFGSAREEIASRFATDKMIGNVAISAGLGYYVDRHSGAGFAYPDTLTVLMRGASEAQASTAKVEEGTMF